MGLRDVIHTQVDGTGVALSLGHRAAISHAVHARDAVAGQGRNAVIDRCNVKGGKVIAPNARKRPIEAADVLCIVAGILRRGVFHGVAGGTGQDICVLLFLCRHHMDDGIIQVDAVLVIDKGILAAVNGGLAVLCVTVIAIRIIHCQLQGASAVFDRAAVVDRAIAGIIIAVIAVPQHSLVGRAVGHTPADVQRRTEDDNRLCRVAPAVANVIKAQHSVLHAAVIIKAILQTVQRGVLDRAGFLVVHILGGVQGAGKGAVVFNRKLYGSRVVFHLVKVQFRTLLNGQDGGIARMPLCVLVVRVKGPALALCAVDAAVCALGEAARFNDQFLYGNAIELDSFRAHSKADCAVLGVIVQLRAAADDTFQLAGRLQGDTGIGRDIDGAISICRPRGHRAVRCHRDREIHRNIGCINGYKPCAFCREIATVDGCTLGQRVIFSGEQTAVDGTFISCNIQLVVEQTAVDDDFRCPFKIRERAFKAAAVDDDLFTIVDIHGAGALALKGAAVDGKGTRCFNGHAAGITTLFKGATFNGDLAARSINNGISFKGAAADDSPGFTDHLAVEGAAGDGACVGHGIAVMVFRADPRLLQGSIGLDLHVPLDAIIVAVIAVITEAEGTFFQDERISVLVVGPAAFAAAEGVAGGLARPVIWKDIGDIVVFLCQCGGAGGVGRGALGKGRQRHCGQCHA